MKKLLRVFPGMLTLVLVLVGVSGEARAADKDATGTWKWSFTRPDGGEKLEITMVLKQEGEMLTGDVAGPRGDKAEIKDGKIKDGAMSFKVIRTRNGNVFTNVYNGKLDGDTIKGKSEMEFQGVKRSRDWEAKRASD
ncbi:MAG: hypothetical protein NVSMB9_25260 [Isosphaeraceae bacterium]